MLEVQLNPALERTLESIARAALVKYMEDLEDYAIAVEAWREHDPAQAISLEQVKRELGLED